MSLGALGLVEIFILVFLILLFVIHGLPQVQCLLLQILVQVGLYQLLDDVLEPILAGDVESHGFEEDSLPEVIEAA